MNKLLFLSALFFVVSFSFAQTKQGNFILGGAFNGEFGTNKTSHTYNNTTTTISNNYSNIEFNPKFGYFVANNLAIGINLGVGTYRTDGNLNSSNLSVGPFMRYYLPIKLFGEAYIGYRNQKYFDNIPYTANGIDFSVGGGFACFIGKKVALEPTLKYAGYAIHNSADSNYKNYRGGLVIGLGFLVYL